MKFHQILIIGLALLFGACEEIPPVITPAPESGEQVETPVSEQKRQVLIEEFSGVRCVNCPAGSDAIQVLLDIYGPQLVPVNIHAGFFAEPYPESLYDLQVQQGYAILEYLGQPLGFPTAVINRKQYPGEDNLQLTQRSWAGYIADDLLTPPPVKIDIIPDLQDRTLSIDIDLYIEEAIEREEVHLSVVITEDGISDFQLTPAGKIGDYSHRHVLRQVLTGVNGVLLTESLTPGIKISRTYEFTIPEDWAVANCEIVAFVHLDGSSKEVLQAHRVKMK